MYPKKSFLLSSSIFLSINTNANEQKIFVQGTPLGVLDNTVDIDFGYSTSNLDETTTGFGFRFHFDSSVLKFKDVLYVLEKDLLVDVVGPFDDDENHDNDESTDKYYSVGWVSLYGNWPNEELPAKLLSVQFLVDLGDDE